MSGDGKPRLINDETPPNRVFFLGVAFGMLVVVFDHFYPPWDGGIVWWHYAVLFLVAVLIAFETPIKDALSERLDV